MADYPIMKGDTARPLFMTLGESPSGRDLSEDDEVRFRYKHVDAAAGVEVVGTIHDATERQVRYDWANAAETEGLTDGEHVVQAIVTYASDGKEETFPSFAPDDASFPTTFEAIPRIPI